MISFGSLVGIFVAPFSDEKGFSMVLTFLVAIAVSTLLGDAVLHLFPHVSIFGFLLHFQDIRALVKMLLDPCKVQIIPKISFTFFKNLSICQESQKLRHFLKISKSSQSLENGYVKDVT